MTFNLAVVPNSAAEFDGLGLAVGTKIMAQFLNFFSFSMDLIGLMSDFLADGLLLRLASVLYNSAVTTMRPPTRRVPDLRISWAAAAIRDGPW